VSQDAKRIQIPAGLCDLLGSDATNLDQYLRDLCVFITNGVGTSYHYTRNGNTEGWLFQGKVFSNDVGIPFGLLNGKLDEIWVGAKNNFGGGGKTVNVYHHDGGSSGLTLLTSQTLSASTKVEIFNTSDFGVINVPSPKQIAVEIDGGNIKEPTVFLRFSGKRDI